MAFLFFGLSPLAKAFCLCYNKIVMNKNTSKYRKRSKNGKKRSGHSGTY